MREISDKGFRDTSNIDTFGATEQVRSADFPVRSNLELSHGFQIIRRLPSTRCCGLESPRSAEEAAITIRGLKSTKVFDKRSKKGAKALRRRSGVGTLPGAVRATLQEWEEHGDTILRPQSCAESEIMVSPHA